MRKRLMFLHFSFQRECTANCDQKIRNGKRGRTELLLKPKEHLGTEFFLSTLQHWMNASLSRELKHSASSVNFYAQSCCHQKKWRLLWGFYMITCLRILLHDGQGGF